MSVFTTGAIDFAPTLDNDALRDISSRISFDASTHRRITKITRVGGAYCMCGGQSLTTTIAGQDAMIDSESGTIIKLSTVGTCTVIGSGPNTSRDYITTEFLDWSDTESRAAIAAWQAGALQIRRTLTKLRGGVAYKEPTFRDGFYHDFITIEGTDVPYTDYRARIEYFSARRTSSAAPNAPEDPEGEIIMLRYRLSMNDVSNIANAQLMLYMLRDVEPTGAPSDSFMNLGSPGVEQLGTDINVRLVTDAGTDLFSLNRDRFLLLRFNCGDEPPSEERAMVSRNMIPLHIASNNNGVAIGGRSTATEQEKKFEVFFPSSFSAPVRFTGGAYGAHVYSETESVTGDVWIDGKPIYRRVITAANIPSDATTDVASIEGLDTPIKLSGFALYGSTWAPINYFVTSSSYRLEAYIANGVLKLTAGTSRAFSRAVFVAEYTKL